MKCEECGRERPLTYRSRKLGKRSVCADCNRAKHPEAERNALPNSQEGVKP